MKRFVCILAVTAIIALGISGAAMALNTKAFHATQVDLSKRISRYEERRREDITWATLASCERWLTPEERRHFATTVVLLQTEKDHRFKPVTTHSMVAADILETARKRGAAKDDPQHLQLLDELRRAGTDCYLWLCRAGDAKTMHDLHDVEQRFEQTKRKLEDLMQRYNDTQGM